MTITLSNFTPADTFTISYQTFLNGEPVTGGLVDSSTVVATVTTSANGDYVWTGNWFSDFDVPESFAPGVLPGILIVTPEGSTDYALSVAESEQLFPGKGYATEGTSFEFSGPGFVNGSLVAGEQVDVVAKGFPEGTQVVGIVMFEVETSTGDLDLDFWTWYYEAFGQGGQQANGTWWNIDVDPQDPTLLRKTLTVPANFTADTKVWTWHGSGFDNQMFPRYGYGVVALETFLEDVIEVAVAPVAPVWVDPVLPLSDPVIVGQKYAGGSVTCTSPAFDPLASSVEFTWTLDGQLLKSESVSTAPFVNSLVLASDVKEGSVLGCRVMARTSIGTGTVVTETTVAAKPVPTSLVTSTCSITDAAKISASFAQGSSTLSASAAKAVRAKSGSACSGTYLVSGHVSGKSTAANRRLANSRAQALVKALASQHPNATFTVVNASKASKALCSPSSKGRCASVRIQQ